MADFLRDFFGGAKQAVTSAVSAASDDAFADFATAASPAAPSHAATTSFTGAATTSTAARAGGFFASPVGIEGRPYTKWYRVWERVTIADFYQEMFIIPIMLVVVLVNVIGSRLNKSRAKQWAAAHLPLLQSEFAVVGFKKGGSKEAIGAGEISDDLFRQKGKNEYIMYATGRANVAFVDVRLSLLKRYNPFLWFAELATSFFFDFVATPVERVEATAVCFDGKEKMLTQASGVGNSSFDGFVWAIVHKDKMKALRDERYDISLTATRDHPKLPEWATVMTESAEITDALITPELIAALKESGESLEALIISDQPIDAPKKLNDLVPRKRVTLMTKLSTASSGTKLFEYFLRLPDQLASAAHFRPEALRKVRATREEEQRKLRKLDDEEKAEERRLAVDKLKKEERDRKLGRMSAEEQKKFLEKEKETERKKQSKKRTMRG